MFKILYSVKDGRSWEATVKLVIGSWSGAIHISIWSLHLSTHLCGRLFSVRTSCPMEHHCEAHQECAIHEVFSGFDDLHIPLTFYREIKYDGDSKSKRFRIYLTLSFGCLGKECFWGSTGGYGLPVFRQNLWAQFWSRLRSSFPPILYAMHYFPHRNPN